MSPPVILHHQMNHLSFSFPSLFEGCFCSVAAHSEVMEEINRNPPKITSSRKSKPSAGFYFEDPSPEALRDARQCVNLTSTRQSHRSGESIQGGSPFGPGPEISFPVGRDCLRVSVSPAAGGSPPPQGNQDLPLPFSDRDAAVRTRGFCPPRPVEVGSSSVRTLVVVGLPVPLLLLLFSPEPPDRFIRPLFLIFWECGLIPSTSIGPCRGCGWVCEPLPVSSPLPGQRLRLPG